MGEYKRSPLPRGSEQDTQSASSANAPLHPLHRPAIVACEDDNYDDLDRPRHGGVKQVVEDHIIDETSAADSGAGCARQVQRQTPAAQQVGHSHQTPVDADTAGPDTGRGESTAGKSNATAQHYSQQYHHHHHPHYFYPQYPSPASYTLTPCEPGVQTVHGNQMGHQMFPLAYYPYPLAHAPHIVGQTGSQYNSSQGMAIHHPGTNSHLSTASETRHQEALSSSRCRVDRKEQAAHANRRDASSAASPGGNMGRAYQETDWNTGRVWREDNHQSIKPSTTANPISAESQYFRPASPRRSIVQRMESSLRSSFGVKNSRLDSIGESEVISPYSSEYLSPNELLSDNLKAKYPNPRAHHKTSRFKAPTAPIHGEQYYYRTSRNRGQRVKSVNFGTVQIRTYETILCDNPSCSKVRDIRSKATQHNFFHISHCTLLTNRVQECPLAGDTTQRISMRR